MTSYSPHSLGGASSPSLPLPHILQPQGMAEESLAENQLVPEAGLQTGERGKAGFLQDGAEESRFKEDAAWED